VARKMGIEPVQLSASATVVYLTAQDEALATSLCLSGVSLMLLLVDLLSGPAAAVSLGFAFAAFLGAALVAGVVDEEYDHGYGIATIVINGLALAVAMMRLSSNRSRFETK
jgi:hypothetical protein